MEQRHRWLAADIRWLEDTSLSERPAHRSQDSRSSPAGRSASAGPPLDWAFFVQAASAQ